MAFVDYREPRSGMYGGTERLWVQALLGLERPTERRGVLHLAEIDAPCEEKEVAGNTTNENVRVEEQETNKDIREARTDRREH